MENNKLGIVINTTKANNRTSGFRAIYSFNNEDWSSVVRDTGAELKKVANNSANDPIHFIQFISNGCCYCIMQSIAGRKDYQSAWLFIHKDIILPKGTLSSIIKKVEEVLSFDVEDKKEELDSLFNKTYSTTESPCFPSSTGDTYAVRYYGDGTHLMYDDSYVLEDYLYQSEYCKYKSVFLINKSKGQSVADATDLSDTKLQKSIVIDLPKDVDGFKPYSGGSVISNAIRITEGTMIAVRWQRSGYVPVEKTGRTTDELLIQKSEYKKSFRVSLFRVIDKVTKKDLNVRPRFITSHWVDNQNNPQFYFFKEDDLNKVSCHVDLATYHSFADNIDLTKPDSNGEFVIELQPEEHIYECYISTDIPDNRKIEFTIRTQHKLRGSEIPGFKFEGVPSETKLNELKAAPQQTPTQPGVKAPKGGVNPKGGNTTKGGNEQQGTKGGNDSRDHHKKGTPWYQYALIAFLFMAVIAGGYMLYKFLFSDKPKTEQSEPEPSKTDWEKAYDYLKKCDEKGIWNKSKMEDYAELKGVFNMMKDYEFDKLRSFIERHKDTLLNLESWSKLSDIVQKNKNKKGAYQPAVSNGLIKIKDYLEYNFGELEDVEPIDESDSQGTSITNSSSNSRSSSSNSSSTTTSSSSSSTNSSTTSNNTQDNNN